MKVEGILRTKGARVVAIRPDATIRSSSRGLRDERIGAMVVSEDGCGRPRRLSERDVVRGLAERGVADPRRTRRRADDAGRRLVHAYRHRQAGDGRDDEAAGAPPSGRRRRPVAWDRQHRRRRQEPLLERGGVKTNVLREVYVAQVSPGPTAEGCRARHLALGDLGRSPPRARDCSADFDSRITCETAMGDFRFDENGMPRCRSSRSTTSKPAPGTGDRSPTSTPHQ